MEPIVNGLEIEYGSKVDFQSLDANLTENLQIQASYGLRGHPTIAVLDENGKVMASFIGPQDQAVLREALTAVLDE